MLNLYPRHQLQARNDVGDGDEGIIDEAEGYNPFYGIAVVCLSVFLFCVLAASVNVWKALAMAALAALLLGVGGCFAKGCLRRRRPTTARRASAELVVTVRASSVARTGYACAQVGAPPPPAFVFQCPVNADDGRSEPAAPAPAAAGSSSVVVCSVCLEDVRGGEMVRQVPACRHTFHVACIDLWLHSHRTCPMCRCVVSPPPLKAVTSRAAAEVPEASTNDDDELPPV